MKTLRSLWRWLTYKRVLIVFDGNYISQVTLYGMQSRFKNMRIDAVFLRVDHNEQPVAVICIDDLTSVQFEWLKAELDKYAQPHSQEDINLANALYDKMKSETWPSVIEPRDLL